MNSCVNKGRKGHLYYLSSLGLPVMLATLHSGRVSSALVCLPDLEKTLLSSTSRRRNISINNTCRFWVSWSQGIPSFSQFLERRGCLLCQTCGTHARSPQIPPPTCCTLPPAWTWGQGSAAVQQCFSQAPIMLPSTSITNPNTEHGAVGSMFRCFFWIPKGEACG